MATKTTKTVRILDILYHIDTGATENTLSKAFGSVESAVKYTHTDILNYIRDLGIGDDHPDRNQVKAWLNGQMVDDYAEVGDFELDMNADDPDYAHWMVSKADGKFWCSWTLHTEEIIE